jgi:hypothetical protein
MLVVWRWTQTLSKILKPGTHKRGKLMAYRVHRLDIDLESNPSKLEDFLNDLKGEVVSIIPNYKRTSLLQIVGAARKIDFVLIVEAVKR